MEILLRSTVESLVTLGRQGVWVSSCCRICPWSRVYWTRSVQQLQRGMCFTSNDTPLTAPIKRNNLLLFHEKKTQKKSAIKLKMQHFKRHAELYGQAFLVLETAVEGIWRSFFIMNLPHTLLHLSPEGSLNSCTKSDLLAYIMEDTTSSAIHDVSKELVSSDSYNFIVIDGGALIHSLPGYSCPRQELWFIFRQDILPKNLPRLEAIDKSRHCLGPVSLHWQSKERTREKRGKGIRQRVSGFCKTSKENWQKFLTNDDNKKENILILVQKDHRTAFPWWQECLRHIRWSSVPYWKRFIYGSVQPWGSWHACLSTSAPRPPILFSMGWFILETLMLS